MVYCEYLISLLYCSQCRVDWDHGYQDCNASKDRRAHGEPEKHKSKDNLQRCRPHTVKVGHHIHQSLCIH